ncbi:TusE/DsrC/DsvC family sulfur relay protein [Chloroflexota bacterium]
MKTKETSRDQQVDIDQEGYLVRAETWTEEKASLLAKEEVPEGLTEDHWKIIECMRQYYLEMGTVPPVRMLARRTGFSLRQMQKLFPSGLTKGACKIAGIPQIAIKPSFLYP